MTFVGARVGAISALVRSARWRTIATMFSKPACFTASFRRLDEHRRGEFFSRTDDRARRLQIEDVEPA
jgi:hypothetical protein